MSDNLAIIPSDGDGYVSLARTRSGKLFRKHLLSFGKLRHPADGSAITIDEAFAKKLKENFDNKVCPIVQVPLANAKNEHTEAPEANIGEVIGLEIKDQKIYGVLDIRDTKHAERIGKTYLGASAMLSLDYTDTKTGDKVGPTLLHSCVTNRPYVTDLNDYEEIVAATTDSSEGAVLLTTETVEQARPEEVSKELPEMGDDVKTEPAKPTLEELLTALKTEHNIDVADLQAKAAEGTQAASLTAALTKALTDSGLVKLTNAETAETVATDKVVGAVAELADKNVKLSNRIDELEKRDAENAVDALVASGHIQPAKRDAFVTLKLSNPTMYDALVPDEPILKLSHEEGVTPKNDKAHVENIDGEVARFAELLKKI